ncbi:MAG: OadG family transporter subunit, partial [Pirellulales bacterium]
MSTIPISVFAVMTLAEKLADAAAVTIVGMGTVFVSLYVIGEIFTLLHRYFHGRADSDDAEPAPITKASTMGI